MQPNPCKTSNGLWKLLREKGEAATKNNGNITKFIVISKMGVGPVQLYLDNDHVERVNDCRYLGC